MALPGTLSAAGAEWTPATSVTGSSSNSWHKRYVRNVTKGVSSLIWGSSAHSKKCDSPTFDSPPIHNFRPVLDWSHITYPFNEAIPTLDFYVARRCTIAKKSSRSSSTSAGLNEKASTAIVSTKAPMLHAKSARSSFHLNPPLILEPRRISFEPEVGGGTTESCNNKSMKMKSNPRSHPRLSISGSSLTAVSSVATPNTSDNIYRCVEALGVITVLPFEIVKTDLYGEVTHRVEFKVTHLLHACFSEVLGIGEVLVCVTAAFTVAVYRIRDLTLLYDIPIHLAENIWMRYYKRHTRMPPPNLNDSRITALASSPSSFSRRHGIFAVGSCSGLTHLWRIPEKALICVLPPPLSPRQAVVGLAFASVDQVECIRDIASPFSRPETSDTSLRQNYLLVFYMDGQCSMWNHSLSRCSASVIDSVHADLDVGSIPPHLQFHYPSIEPPLRSSDLMVLERLILWRPQHVPVTLEALLECGDCVALFVKIDELDFGFIIIHPQSSRIVEPLVTFQDLNIPIAVHQPCAVCYAALEFQRRVFIVATPGVLRVIEMRTSDRGSILDESEQHLSFDMNIRLDLIATIPVSRKTEFCKAKYDADFDELLLGLTTGEIVKIDGLSDLVLRP